MITNSSKLNFTSFDQVKGHVFECMKRADDYTGKGAWIHRCSQTEIENQLVNLSILMDQKNDLPLLGLTVAVKDNIDVAGLPTTAACPAYQYTPSKSAFVVQQLTKSGAIVMGKTNLDQFATGLVGVRSPYGACENFYDRKYISGGSSSGSAIAVAAGMADFSLGTDTAGSGRIPAAFNNLIGLKPSKGLISTTGVVPACRSLDCVSIFARDCETAERVFGVAKGYDESDIYSRNALPVDDAINASQFRFGVPAASDLNFFGNPHTPELFEQALHKLSSIGGQRELFDYGPFYQVSLLLYEGPWVAERLAAIGDFYYQQSDQILPVIKSVIGPAEKMSAVDTFRGMYKFEALRKKTLPQWNNMDIMAVPSAGTIYTIDEVVQNPVQLNRNLGYYTNFVNLLDLCALAIPAGFMPNGLPFGITLIAPAGCEKSLLKIARSYLSGGEK